MISRHQKDCIAELKLQFEKLRVGKDELLKLLGEAEIAESVYNSNAIENSTLSLAETEKILFAQQISRNVSVREVFEAKNLARVTELIRSKAYGDELSLDLICSWHTILMTNIKEDIAGRFRTKGEYVRVGTHIAAPPENVAGLMATLLINYASDLDAYYLDKITKFHLIFETIHPFNDGNGRLGRVLINYQLARLGLPPIIIRNKEKKFYYRAFENFQDKANTKPMEKIMVLALMESLHKRVTYLKGETIITLAQFAKKENKPAPILLNAAKRQTIPAFRERGVWKIGIS